MIRVIVTGAAGKMGREVVRAVSAQEDMEIVAVVDPSGDIVEDGKGGTHECITDLCSALAETGPDVMVDFTRPDSVLQNVVAASAVGVDCVVGTTGVGMDSFEDALSGAPSGTSIFIAPNFALGAVLMMRFASEAARHMPDVEIVEMHHDRKADAPSGTALLTAAQISEASGDRPQRDRGIEIADGALGAIVDGVPVHSVRLPGLVAHQQIMFGATGETLTIRHDSLDRTCFMPGVVLAIRASSGLGGVVVGLDTILED